VRQLVCSKRRPHCCVLLRDNAALVQEDLDQQAVLFDLSLRALNAQVLEELTQQSVPREGAARAAWQASGGFEHLSIWSLYVSGRMGEVDYPR
jgi:hypothetical protein